jgi:AraC-like DNA-binding protein
MAIKVTVFVTVADNVVHGFVHQCFQVFIPLIVQQIANAFNPLGNVGVPENVGHIGITRFPLALQCLETVGLLETVIYCVYGGVTNKILLCFPESAILKVYDSLVSLPAEKDGFYATLKFFAILYELSLCEEAYTLSSNSFSKVNINSDSRRVRLVQNYINEHYKEEIRLKQLSEMVKMSPVSFSRFFKLRTGKSLSDYIVDIRLGHAARLLFSTTNTVSEICYECGFNNISNFNRLFKKNKNCSPKEFREMYKKKSLL